MQKNGIVDNKVVNYVKASYSELKHVVWPTRKQTIQHTLLVIVFSLGVALFLGLLDMIFSLGLTEAIKKLK